MNAPIQTTPTTPVEQPIGFFGIQNEMRKIYLNCMQTQQPSDRLMVLCEQLKDRIEQLNARYQTE